jgi:Uma2 family endonuclease
MAQTIATSSPVPDEAAQARVLLNGISWGTYSSMLSDIGDGAARLTYDNGLLEIELPGRLHELIKSLVAGLVMLAMKKLGIDYEPAGATTWRKQVSLKGLEADECYHIQHLAEVAGKSELDLNNDPPPDLAIEIEVTSPAIDKMEVYRGLKVPELWRINADATCTMYLLNAAGNYEAIHSSAAIALFTPAIVSQYLLLREQLGHSKTLRRFEAEILGHIAK